MSNTTKTTNTAKTTNLTAPEQALRFAMSVRKPAMLVGEPGTAKTASVAQLTEELGYDLITIVASRLEPQDISGFPTRSTDENGRVFTEYAPQSWQHEIMTKKKVVLFFDEFSNTHPSVRAALLSLIQDRQFPNGDKFPEETIIVGAMNPKETAADGYDLDPATTNRIMFLPWEVNRESWLAGMPLAFGRVAEDEIPENEKKWRRNIVRFIDANPGYLHKMNFEVGTGEAYGVNINSNSERAVLEYAWASPRSWDNVASLLGAMEAKNGYVEDMMLQGTVGYSAAAQFRDWLSRNEGNVEEMLRAPKKFKDWEALSVSDLDSAIRASVDGATDVKGMNLMFDVFEAYHNNDLDSIAASHLHAMIQAANVVKRQFDRHSKDWSKIQERLNSIVKMNPAAFSQR